MRQLLLLHPKSSTTPSGHQNNRDPHLTASSDPATMAPRKKVVNGAVAIKAPVQPETGVVRNIPVILRFPLVVLLSLTLSAMAYSLSSDFMVGDLSAVSRTLNEWWQISGLLGCKVLELGAGWWFEYDSWQLRPQSQ